MLKLKIFSTLFSLLLLVSPLSAAAASPAPCQREKARQEYSDRTLILSTAPDFSQKDRDALCQKYNLTVLYVYKNFHMLALSTQKPYSDWKMRRLIQKLQQEPGILEVQRDRILHLD